MNADRPEDWAVTYPLDAQRRVADRLMEIDWNMPDDEAMCIAFDITTDVTMAVDDLRAQEEEDR